MRMAGRHEIIDLVNTMKIYHFVRKQLVPATMQQAWDFFSDPRNLSQITPPDVEFKMLYSSGSGKMYAGQIIRYTISVLPGIKVHWVTEITHVNEPHHFIDVQRYGPYAFWHHQHAFREVPGGVEMIDEVNYAIPFGWFGRIANTVFVARKLMKIFDYRRAVIDRVFQNSGNLASDKESLESGIN